MTPCQSSRNFPSSFSPLKAQQIRTNVKFYVPKSQISTWAPKVYSPEEWSRLTIQKKWQVIKSKKHARNEPISIQKKVYYGAILCSYVEQLVTIWVTLQSNLLSLKKSDQMELRDYFNMHVSAN